MADKTFTEEELNNLIAQKVEEAVTKKTDELTSKHNSDMAQLRKTSQKEREEAIEKAKADAKLSAEELAKKENEEKLAEKETELEELRSFKKSSMIKENLLKSKLPEFLANDSRLLNAKTDDELKTAIEAVSKDYASSIPNGSNINTNVQGSGNDHQLTEKEQKMEHYRNLK